MSGNYRAAPGESTQVDRFWEKVYKTEECWFWVGSTTHNGYGQLTLSRDDPIREYRAHRISWVLHRGLIPAGVQVLHNCDTRNCIRPAHLFTGSAVINTHDRLRKGQAARPQRVEMYL